MKTFTILGCGWLGLAVAKQLRTNYHFKVSTTSPSKLTYLKNEGFKPYILDEEHLDTLDELLQCDYLLIAFPPSKFQNYLQFLETIYSHKLFKFIRHTIFISSSSMYDKREGIYNEEALLTDPSSKTVYDAEMYVMKTTSIIFRCAGLMGANRIGGSYFANKEVKKAESPVNYVHQNDVVKAIGLCVEENIRGVFNLCAPMHPSKKELYKSNALKYRFEEPIFTDEETFNRIIDGSKICQHGFEYTYPNPLTF